jgi:hypothetical protein
MTKTIVITNRKYYRPFDNTDNPCCWQVEAVGRDIDEVLAEAGIKAEGMYEDWGAAWSWFSRGIEHGMHLECTDVERAEYTIACSAWRRTWYLWKADVPDNESDFGAIARRLEGLAASFA